MFVFNEKTNAGHSGRQKLELPCPLYAAGATFCYMKKFEEKRELFCLHGVKM